MYKFILAKKVHQSDQRAAQGNTCLYFIGNSPILHKMIPFWLFNLQYFIEKFIRICINYTKDLPEIYSKIEEKGQYGKNLNFVIILSTENCSNNIFETM